MEKKDLNGLISLDEILEKHSKNTKDFITEIDKEEAGERIETVASIRNGMKADISSTNRKKQQFIDEMKNGVGNDIKAKEGYGVKIKKETFLTKLKKKLIKLYEKF